MKYQPTWLIKLTRFEYWPVWIVYFPSFFYWIYLSVKARNFGYVSAANPAIENGGVFGESKANILSKIPEAYTPRTLQVSHSSSSEELMHALEVNNLTFPLVCKPDKGERGFRVSLVKSHAELHKYAVLSKADFLIQECIDWPLEFGVLYFRKPDGTSGITSITGKKFLSVIGDGVSDVATLMTKIPRGKMQLDRIKKERPDQLISIPAAGEKYIVESIGNHCLGTEFINRNDLIHQDMIALFDKITEKMNGFHFGRFDLKVKHESDLRSGLNLRILELNGCTSEPGHIYDRKMNLLSAWRQIFLNMALVHDIAMQNINRGVVPVAFSKIFSASLQHFKNK